MMKRVYLSILTAFFLLGCGDNNASNSNEKEANEANVETQQASPQNPAISDDIINDIIQSIPSPLEISVLIKEVGSMYQRSDLNDPDAVSRYGTNFKKALNLGVYGTDLGYANIYGKTQDALSYLNSVKKLADGLSIGQFFDYNTIKELAESASNLDALIQTTTSNFEKINYHLRQQKRENLSILILTGGWIEAVYLTTLVHQRANSEVLKEKIGEQKIVLDQILLVLDVYKSKPDFPNLINDLTELQNIYSQIEIETVYDQPTMEEVDGVLVVIDNTKSKIDITDADVDSITSLVRSIRNKIIQ